MGRLHTVPSRLRTIQTAVKPAIGEENRYGKGRGGRPWRRKRLEVFSRDLYTCQQCGRVFPPERLACDHRTPLAQGGQDNDENLQALCDGPGSCHEAKSREEAKAMRS